MMSQERWQRLRSIVQPALELAPDDVEDYLRQSCRGDRQLQQEVERLLRACRSADDSLGFLDSPAALLAAPLLESPRLQPDLLEPIQDGTSVGPYTIERLIGRGGMGVVFLAQDHRLNRKVALKVLPPWLAAAEDAVRRFAQEARAASQIDHPNIATVYEVGETPDGRLYIAMAYYDGETLQERIARGPVDVDIAVGLARQIAEGLSAAHGHGIVHRDIKPGNVIVTREGLAKILDFGAAKITGHQLTGPGVALGTVAYMSPEQTRQDEVDCRSDVWSLGVVLYELLTGRRPFAAQHPDALIQAIRNDEPEPLETLRPGLPEGLIRAVGCCLRKDPSSRFRNGAELSLELGRVQLGVEGMSGPDRSRPRRGTPSKRSRVVAAVTAVTVLLVAGFLQMRSTLRAAGRVVIPSDSTIAILPFTPVGEDSGLRRLGRDLAVTLGASLDGVGGIRTTDALAVLAQVREGETPPPERAGELARRLGARSILHGTLVRVDEQLRLEMRLSDANGKRLLARATATAPWDDIGAVTDSATLAILQELWKGGRTPAPNPAAISTRSLPALRAYLEGEMAFARGEFDRAVPAFERAFAADSTFALAYWRSLYPRIYEGSRPDSTIVASLVLHRDRLRDPERMMVEAYAARTVGEKLAILEQVTSRFADYWPGWYGYGNELFHRAPYLGGTQAQAQKAMERALALNPDFAMAWQHLLWIAALQRDSAAADRAVTALERFAAPDAYMYHPLNMVYFRSLRGLLRSGGEFSADEAASMARVAMSGARRVPPPEVTAVNLLNYGFPRAQLQQAEATLRERTSPRMTAAQWMGKAFSWATRGAWDSALVAGGQWIRLSDDAGTPLQVYGLAVLGALTGALEPAVALSWRPDPGTADAARTAAEKAEMAWLDGVRAYLDRDLSGITRSLRALTGSGAQHDGLLAASLQAFHRHASGDRAEAARSLAAMEWEFADQWSSMDIAALHPHLSAVHRPAAARWLLEAGDTLQAMRLLSWHEAIPGVPAGSRAKVAGRVVSPLAMYERARLEEARERFQDARQNYRRFLELYDLPPKQHQAMVTEARAALRRLDTRVR